MAVNTTVYNAVTNAEETAACIQYGYLIQYLKLHIEQKMKQPTSMIGNSNVPHS
jgi:hypothetical protein